MYAELSESCFNLAGKEWTTNRSWLSKEVKDNIIKYYFPKINDEADAGKSKLRLISDLSNFFSTPPGQHIFSQVKDDDVSFLAIDFQHFQKVCAVKDFYETLEEKPKEALLCISAAVSMHKVQHFKGDGNCMDDFAKINIRLHNHPKSMIALKSLKAPYIDRLVSVRGTVVKVSTVRPLVMHMNFSCTKCGTNISCNFPDGKFSPPSICVVAGCKSRTFSPIRSTAIPIDFQKIRLQELLKSEHHEEGRVPRTVDCELTEDLVDVAFLGMS